MKLSTTTIGSGPKTAALIHGITGDGGTWFELAPWIADHGYTVTLVDQRGHGRSDRAGSYLSPELADDLVDTLPAGMDLIVGHSLGGRSLSMAVDRLLPSRAVYLDPAWFIPEGIVIARPIRDDGGYMSIEELGEVEPTRSRAHLEQAIRSNKLFDATYLEAPNWPLATIEPGEHPAVPSLVVAADPSAVTPPEMQERLAAGGYTVRMIPGGLHDLHVDNLAETKAVLQDWL